MPYAVDDAKLTTKPGAEPVVSLDMAKPPVKPIKHMEFPMVVYKHPVEPFMKIEHRNTQHELVNTEIVPAEALAKSVACAKHAVTPEAGKCEACQKELEAALEDGWTKEIYIPKAAPDPNAHLYGGKKSKK